MVKIVFVDHKPSSVAREGIRSSLLFRRCRRTLCGGKLMARKHGLFISFHPALHRIGFTVILPSPKASLLNRPFHLWHSLRCTLVVSVVLSISIVLGNRLLPLGVILFPGARTFLPRYFATAMGDRSRQKQAYCRM